MSLEADGGYKYVVGLEVDQAVWSADERTFVLEREVRECDTTRFETTYYVRDDVFHAYTFEPVGDVDGVVGTWERTMRERVFACAGPDTETVWNAVLELSADGTGSIEEDLPFGRDRHDVEWAIEDDRVVLEYVNIDPPPAEPTVRPLFMGDGVVLGEWRYERSAP